MKKRQIIKTAGIFMSILIVSLVLPSTLKLFARDTLSGIVEQVEEIASREDATYRILEIVPDRSLARLGFYFEGQEPLRVCEDDGTILFDAWDEENKVWKSWQSGLEQFAAEEQRENYIYRLVEGIRSDEKINSLFTVLDNTALTVSGNVIGTVSGNVIGTVSGNTVKTPESGTPIVFSTYNEVTAEQYEEDPGAYKIYEVGGGEKKGYFSHINSESYGGTRYDVKFSGYGELKAGDTGSYYTLKEKTKIDDVGDSAWDARVNENVYVKDSGGNYSYAGTLQGIREAASINPPSDMAGAAQYWYLEFERAAAPAVGDGRNYYIADYEQDENGTWGLELTDEEDIFADTISMSAYTIYYEGGFTNYEWFKRYAYDMEEDTFSYFDVKISTMTIDELNNQALAENFYDNFDFISIQDGEYMGEDGTLKKGFADGTDFDKANAEQLFSDIVQAEIPTVVDSTIVFTDGTGNQEDGGGEPEKIINEAMRTKKENLWKLTALLLQQSPEQFLPEAGEDGSSTEFAWDDADGIIDWKEIENNKGFVEDADKNYVNQNIYSSYGSTFVSNDFESKVINDAQLGQETVDSNMEGFEDVLLEIESENMYREAEASWIGELLSTDIRQSAILRYIINYSYQRATYLKTKINILDIEPCCPDKDSFPLTKADVMEWIAEDSSITEEDISITTMTVSEFIGKNEDLNETYDLIYIGTDADKLNIEDKRTVFNDSSMNGLVYFNTGDYRYGAAQLGGMLETEYYSSTKLYEYVKVRYNGLDITKDKMNALISYAEAAYPIVLAEDFYTKDAAGETVIDESYIDNSSYMYEFAKKMLEENRKNVFSRTMLGGTKEGGKANVKLFSFYLNRPKLELVNTRIKSSSLDANGVYNIAQEDGWYTLEYGFTINNIGAVSYDTRYRCELYIDINADGKFSPLERVDDISVSGGDDSSGNLKSGVAYTLRRRVPDGYKGVLAWKVEISQVNNGNIRSSMSGYSKMLDMKGETISILQICRDELYWSGGDKNPWKTSGGWWDQENNRRLNLESELNNQNSNYYKLVNGGTVGGVYYPGILEDFSIDVKCVTVSEFEKMYAEAEDKKSVLRDYNMLILGFSDCYGNLNTDCINGKGGITEFIEGGKSVLFAHDTTSFFNYDYGSYGYPDNSFRQDSYGAVDRKGQRKNLYSYGRNFTDVSWAYNLNRFVRPLVGMDRYGVGELNVHKSEGGEVVSVTNTARSDLLRKGSNLSEGTGEWEMLQGDSYDIAYKPGSNRTQAVPEAQGYTYSIIALKDRDQNRYLNENEAGANNINNSYLNYNFAKYWNSNYNNVSDGAGDSVMKITQVNEGQVTTYPYKLPETFTVSDTHGQYYQLNMNEDDDHDGETDLVVWYCLGENSDGGRNVYSISPNDVSNNYYIYNKGNITYTGMGHAGRDSAKPEYVEEAKLFINTMIAAYSAGIKPAEVMIVDEMTNKKISDIYNYYDIGNDLHYGDNLEVYQKVYFTVNDLNFVKGTRTISTQFYLETETGDTDISFNGGNYKANLLEGLPVFIGDKDGDDSNDTQTDASKLLSGGIYYVRVPRSMFEEGKSRQSLFVEATSKIQRYNEEITTPPVLDRVDFVQLRLFELD